MDNEIKNDQLAPAQNSGSNSALSESSMIIPGGPTILKESYNIYKTTFSSFLPFILLIGVLNSIPNFFNAPEGQFPPFPIIVINVLVSIAAFYFTFCIQRMVVNAHIGKTESFGETTSNSLSLFFPYLLISILGGLVSIGGFLLLIIPGLVLSTYLTFTVFTLIEENIRGQRALAVTWAYLKGQWGTIFVKIAVIGLCLFPLYIIAFFPLLLANFGGIGGVYGALLSLSLSTLLLSFITPLYSIALYRLFSLLRAKKGVVTEEEIVNKKKKLLGLQVLGGFLIIVVAASFLVFGGGRKFYQPTGSMIERNNSMRVVNPQ